MEWQESLEIATCLNGCEQKSGIGSHAMVGDHWKGRLSLQALRYVVSGRVN